MLLAPRRHCEVNSTKELQSASLEYTMGKDKTPSKQPNASLVKE